MVLIGQVIEVHYVRLIAITNCWYMQQNMRKLALHIFVHYFALPKGLHDSAYKGLPLACTEFDLVLQV